VDFRWIDFNIAKVEKHNLTVADVEFVIMSHPAVGRGDGKLYVEGATPAGRWIRVIFVEDDGIFVIHAMPISSRKASGARRRRRR
jgi:uncharacterized DUF497 family protein